ncbi:MAG: cysteine--tRNA ligase [Candidatus Pacebacteria bacterium]|nr:cysteine--tRNA ligase [Candidatus Paceibacterota bacterium]
MKIYNTFTRSVEEVVPLHAGNNIGLYACGPTVYDYAHLGHLRKYIMDDVLIRVLRHSGLTVTHVMNITDVGHLVSDADEGEDKMEKGARKYGKSVWDIAKEFESFFWKGLDAVGVSRPDISCRATDHIAEQIMLIQTLEKRGFTYILDDGLYFDTSKFPEYGQLAKLDIEKLKAGARVEMVHGKKHPTDFALWKFSSKNEKRQMEWDSPWGKGFPGWHIECSAMSMKYLGDQFDVHTGGIDHIPVHHTNEIAQSEAATGKKPFVKYWVHHNFLRVDGEKMSKSLNNFYTIDDVIQKGFSPMALRLLYLSAHYRDELNFTWDTLAASQTAGDRLVQMASGWKKEEGRTELSGEKLEKIEEYRSRFFTAIEHDLHTPEAVAVLWEMTKSNIPSKDKYDLLCEFDEVLGLGIAGAVSQSNGNEKKVPVPQDIAKLATQRWQAKQTKDFTIADLLRKKIEDNGWVVTDNEAGYIVKKKT